MSVLMPMNMLNWPRLSQRHDGGRDPVQAAVLGAVTEFAVPDLTAQNGLPESGVKRLVVQVGFDDAVVLLQQLLQRVAADLAHARIGVADVAVQIGGGHDGVLVQCELLVRQIGQGGMQVALALLVLAYQVAHDVGECLQVVVVLQRLLAVDEGHQFECRGAQ